MSKEILKPFIKSVMSFLVASTLTACNPSSNPAVCGEILPRLCVDDSGKDHGVTFLGWRQPPDGTSTTIYLRNSRSPFSEAIPAGTVTQATVYKSYAEDVRGGLLKDISPFRVTIEVDARETHHFLVEFCNQICLRSEQMVIAALNPG